MPEHRLAEQDAGQELADNRRLVETLRAFGQHTADDQERRDLEQESQQLGF